MLSLIAIAKNESAFMADFLNHHTQLFDEMIVVDTGSDDGTADIARAHGAKVFSFDWCDDFSLARNFSLGMATGDWVMSLDIDEIIDPKDFPRLRESLRKGPACYQLPQWNYYDDSRHMEWQPVAGLYPQRERKHKGYFQAQQYRLFPTGHNLKWEGRVHEDLSASVAASGLPKLLIDVPIHHYGYVMSQEHNKGRNEFYGRLVRKKVDDHPEDPKALLEMAYILIQEGRGREAIPVLEKAADSGARGLVQGRIGSMLAALYREDGKPAQAIEMLHQTVTENPNWLYGWRDIINLLLECEHFEQAEMALKAATANCGENQQLMQQEIQLYIKTRRLREAIPIARRLGREVPGLEEFSALADKCEALARKEGQT